MLKKEEAASRRYDIAWKEYYHDRENKTKEAAMHAAGKELSAVRETLRQVAYTIRMMKAGSMMTVDKLFSLSS